MLSKNMNKKSRSDGPAPAVVNKPRPFICEICSKNFSRRYHLNRHLKIHSNNKLPDSETCHKIVNVGKSKKSSFKLKSDQNFHHTEVVKKETSYPCDAAANDQIIKCDVCFQNFKNIVDLEIHKDERDCKSPKLPLSPNEKHSNCKKCPATIKIELGEDGMPHSNENPYHCKDCDKRFPTVNRMNTRSRTNNDCLDKPHKCHICGKSFGQNYHLKRHLTTHTQKKPFNCKLCDKKFLWKISLVYHMRAHNGEKPFKCDICEKGFSDSGGLNRHIRTHSNVKPFKCKMCNKNFLEKCRLTQHMKVHLDIKPYKCELCSKSFTEKGPLEIHKRVHTGERPFICKICGKGFPRKSRLNEHLRLHSGEKPHKCEVCKKEFSQKSYLRKHMKFHTGGKPHECDICHRFFSRMDNLNVHRRTHSGEKPYECSVCFKRFSGVGNLKVHERMHTGEKPFKCDICLEPFFSRPQLNSHLKLHTVTELASIKYFKAISSDSNISMGENSMSENIEYLVCSPTIIL